MALVEGAAFVGESLRLTVEVAILFSNASVFQDSLSLSVDESDLVTLRLEANKRAELRGDLARDLLHFYPMLAAGTAHEGPCDTQVRPAVLKKLHQTDSMEHMTA